MKAIILAAGRGSRLGGLTDDTPKPMMQVAGKPLLQHQIDGYREAGVEDINIVRGYLAERIHFEGVNFFLNADWAQTGLLPSLFAAEDAMEGGFIFSYSDTVWRASQAALLRAHLEANPGHIAVVVDVDWLSVYDGRDQHPVDEAECAQVDAEGRVVKVGKIVSQAEAHGEVAGMGGVGAEAVAAFRSAWAEMAGSLKGLETPFGQKKVLRHAYVTDLMGLLGKRGVPFVTVDVEGGWREIDTPQDLERVREIW
jgi:choline kinase